MKKTFTGMEQDQRVLLTGMEGIKGMAGIERCFAAVEKLGGLVLNF